MFDLVFKVLALVFNAAASFFVYLIGYFSQLKNPKRFLIMSIPGAIAAIVLFINLRVPAVMVSPEDKGSAFNTKCALSAIAFLIVGAAVMKIYVSVIENRQEQENNNITSICCNENTQHSVVEVKEEPNHQEEVEEVGFEKIILLPNGYVRKYHVKRKIN